MHVGGQPIALGPDPSFEAFLRRLSAAAVSGEGRPNKLAMGASRMTPDVKRHLLDVYGGMQVVESVELVNGQIFDWVPIEAQPAARLFE